MNRAPLPGEQCQWAGHYCGGGALMAFSDNFIGQSPGVGFTLNHTFPFSGTDPLNEIKCLLRNRGGILRRQIRQNKGLFFSRDLTMVAMPGVGRILDQGVPSGQGEFELVMTDEAMSLFGGSFWDYAIIIKTDSGLSTILEYATVDAIF